VANEVVQDTSDKKQGVPMLLRVARNTGDSPEGSSMDAGCLSEDNVSKVEGLGREALIPPDRLKRGDPVQRAPRGRIPKGLSLADRMRRKLKTKRGRQAYARRKVAAEPVFGRIEQARGFRQFLLRGMEKVRTEWSLICTGHNLLKLWRAASAGPPRVQWGLA